MTEKDRIILEIMHLAYLVQINTKFCVFFSFSGHVDKFEVRICASKENWQTELLSSEFHTAYKDYIDQQDPLAYFKAKRDILAKIINEHNIPYEECDVKKYLVEDYTF